MIPKIIVEIQYILIIWISFFYKYINRFPQEVNVGEISAAALWELFSQDIHYVLQGWMKFNF